MGTDVLFGSVDITGGTNYFFEAGQVAVSPFTVSASGTLERLKIELRDSPGAMNVRGVVYADSSGSPGAQIAFGSTPVTGGAPSTAVLTLDSTPIVTAGQVVWAGIKVTGGNCNTYGVGTFGLRGKNGTAGTTAPDPFGTADFTDNPPARGIPVLGEGTTGGSALEQNPSDTFAGTDAVARDVGDAQADSIAGTDAVARDVTTPRADTGTITDAIVAAAGRSFTISDAIQGTDGASKQPGLGLADAATVTDTGLGTSAELLFEDGLTVTDSINAGGTTAHSKAVDDAIQGTDAAACAAAYAATVGDGIQGVDQALPTFAAARSFADTGSVTDFMSTGASSAHEKTLDDAIASTDSLARAFDASRAFDDTATATDASLRAWSVNVTLADLASVSESVDGIGAPIVVYVGRAEPQLAYAGRIG